MGQYYIIANLDKREYLWPQTFGESPKLLEFGSVGSGMLCGLALLLADGNGRGDGDLRSDASCVGRWAGDRIVVSGDYADSLPDGGDNLYARVHSVPEWRQISEEVIRAMCDDEALKAELRKGLEWTLEQSGDEYQIETLLAMGADIPAHRLKEWQIARGLAPDGTVGPNVVAAAKLSDQRPEAPTEGAEPVSGLVWDLNAEPEEPAPDPDPDDTSMFEVEGD